MRLKQLQRLIYAGITTPDGSVDGRLYRSVAERALRGDVGLPAARRLQIYTEAYFLRLLSCLREDFPATSTVLGDARFEALARSYIAHHPPTEPSIDHAGRHFPTFLRDHSILLDFPFVAELARLDQAITEVFIAPDSPVLDADEMRKLAPEAWPTLVLRTHPASRMLECEWRVGDVRRAIDNATPWRNPHRERTVLLVWRNQMDVYFRELEPAESAALRVASEGAAFCVICETLARAHFGEDPAEAINRLLGRWLADGVLAVCDLRAQRAATRCPQRR
jgi:hypothetical protein